MSEERTNEELADALLTLDGPSELFIAIAARLRANDGERIEGIVVGETKDEGDFHRIVFEQRRSNMTDPGGYARATLILHNLKESQP